MSLPPTDTASRQRKRYFELLRQLTPAERLRIVSVTSRRVRQMVEASVRERLGNVSEAEVKDAIVERLYGTAAKERLARYWR
jgi:hypothetical protein